MLISTTLHVLGGALIGTATGLLPGLHSNNIAPIMISLPLIDPNLTVFIASAVASFTVSSNVPSILLGAPSGGNISVLPGHKLTNSGKGITGIDLTLKGSLVSLTLTPILAVVFLALAPKLYGPLSMFLPFLLLATAVISIRNPQGVVITVLSASLGLTALEGKTIMPMLTGFFGVSTLMISITRENQSMKQETRSDPSTGSLKITRTAALSTCISTFFGAIPAVSSAITAVVGKSFGRMNKEEYLSFIGASNITYVTVSFLALIGLGKTRSGATVALAATKFTSNPVIPIASIMVAGSIAYLILKTNLPRIARKMNKIDHWKINLSALAFLILLNLFVTNGKGLIVLLTSTSIGLAAVKTRASRVNCMSSLTVPTALLLL